MRIHRAILTLGILPLLLFTTGCGAKKMWYMPGTSYTQMQRDLAQCKYEAERSTIPYVPHSGLGVLIASGVRKGKLTDECMLAKGYQQAADSSVPDYAKTRDFPARQPLRPLEPNEPLKEDDFLPYAGAGNSTITGQAFLKTRGGDVKLGAGNQVLLCPVTGYSTEYFNRMIVANEQLQAPDPRIEKYFRSTRADASGNFEFTRLPTGSYYLGCRITWEIGGPNGLQTEGGIAHAKVIVGNSETAKVIVTR